MKLRGLIGLLILTAFVLMNSSIAGETYMSGYLQGLYGGGIDGDNPTSSDLTSSETRLQIRLESFSDEAEFFGRLDFVYDDFNNPYFKAELREGFAKFKLGGKLDVKIGRQIATWGTGDLVFINDLFAKDYQSFFIGRDDQYLKSPHNALRIEYYSGLGDFAVVYSPRFTPNIIPSGERLSYFNPMAGFIVGGDENLFYGTMPEAKIKNGEIASKFSRYFGSVDLSLYYYKGFYKNPVGIDMESMGAYYPELNAYGGSLRFPFLGGIAWFESGYYLSKEDESGNNASVPNSTINSLGGFERQLASGLTANIQYQNRIMLDHDVYLENLNEGAIVLEKSYHLVTSRITKLLFMENLNLSGFVFYSPTEEDIYIRLSAAYKHTDAVTLTIGGNLFDGEKEYTDFGAFQKNDNIYLKITYGY